MSGKWEKLTDHLTNDGSVQIKLSDDEMANIVGSSDQERPYRIDHQTHSIKQRASDAGYDVAFDPQDKQIKIFTKRS